jgi:hypothetical protein
MSIDLQRSMARDVGSFSACFGSSQMLWIVYIGEVCERNHQWQRQQRHETVLGLATLGDVTQMGLFLFFVASPKVAKASTVSCSCRCHCRQCKHSFNGLFISFPLKYFFPHVSFGLIQDFVNNHWFEQINNLT